MHAVLALEQAVGGGALDHHRSALQTGFVAVLIVQHFHGHAVGSGPAVVHPVEHLGPVLRLGAAGTGMEGQDGVAVVVLAVQHGHELQLIHRLLHGVDRLFGFGDQFRVVLLVQHFQHGFGVIVQALQLFKAVQLAAQVAHLVEHLLAQLGIVIEAGAGHGVLQLLHTLAGGLDGEGLFQVLHRCAVFGQLHFQFFSRDHSQYPLKNKKYRPYFS